MWWVGGSHLVNFWAIYSVVWKKVCVAPDKMYVLPDAHIIYGQNKSGSIPQKLNASFKTFETYATFHLLNLFVICETYT